MPEELILDFSSGYHYFVVDEGLPGHTNPWPIDAARVCPWVAPPDSPPPLRRSHDAPSIVHLERPSL